jgi:hypothetical protein
MWLCTLPRHNSCIAFELRSPDSDAESLKLDELAPVASPSRFEIDDYFPTNFAQSEHLGNGPISRAGTINPKIRASIQRVHPEVCLLNAQLERSRKFVACGATPATTISSAQKLNKASLGGDSAVMSLRLGATW